MASRREGAPWSSGHGSHGDDYACMQVRRYVSGLPTSIRKERVFLVIQVAIDDSNRGQEDMPAFILAGFMGRVENWFCFADAWQKQLDADPPISLLKAKEAINLDHNFKDWTPRERDERLLAFVKIIKKYSFASVRLAIRKADFNIILKQSSGALKKMYALPTAALVSRVVEFAIDRKMRQTFEFIFDKEIMSPNQLQNMYRGAVKDLPVKAARVIKGFRHDTDDNFYPLQAADLFAGYVREELVEISEGREFNSPVLDALLKIHCVDIPLSDETLMNIRKRLINRLGV